MKKIYLIVVLALVMGCQSTKEIDNPSPKQYKNSRLYKLYIENNSRVYVEREYPYPKEPTAIFTHKKWGEVLFENGKKYVNIQIPKKISQKTLISKFFVISKKGNSEKLLGEFIVYGIHNREPQFSFKEYVYLAESEKKRYRQLKKPREESTHSHDWLKAWDTCSGHIALKKDGSLWQFGEVGGDRCVRNIGFYLKSNRYIYTYLLKPRKIAKGFANAKIINGGYRFYAIKEDGTLWGLGKELSPTFKQIGKESDWSSFAVTWEGHACCNDDIGLKKDGSLWRMSFDKKVLTPITKHKNWDKVLIECCHIYAQKRDGTFWVRNDKDFKLSKNGVFDISNKMRDISKILSGKITFKSYLKEIAIKQDGTLWLPPIMDAQSVDEPKPAQLAPLPVVQKKG